MTEVHTIAAIGMAELKSMSELAAQLNITVGTLTVGINNLVKKDLWNVIRLSVTEGLLR